MLDRHLGHYHIREELGAGGMGSVYLARLTEPAHGLAAGAAVAVKVVHRRLAGQPEYLARFLREAELGVRVVHENVVRTLGAGSLPVDGETVHFLVTEFVEGVHLRTLLGELGTVPDALLREIARQVASGLTAIHEAGAVHRDLKPENVLITRDHRVRIMDLGVARLVQQTVGLTAAGQFAGSLYYAAPEQFRGREVGPRSDLYSLGVLIYELATGVNPFRHDQAAAVMKAHLEMMPQPIHQKNPEASLLLSEFAAVLLSKEPEGRFASAQEARAVLEAGESGAWWKSRERELRRQRGHLPRIPVPRETRVIGRTSELAELRRRWDDAAAGRGGIVLIEGEAGIGKTRLVDAFVETLEGVDAHVLYGAYLPFGTLGGLSDAILDHFGATGLEEALRPYLEVTPRLVPAFAAMIRHASIPEGAEPVQGDTLHALFVNLLQRFSDEKPLLWVLEDLHLAQPDSRRIVLALAQAASRRRVLLVGTARPEIPEAELVNFSRLSAFSRVPLGRLGARDVIEVLRDAFRSEALAEKLGGKIAYKSDGVPHFVIEIVRGLKEGRFVSQTPDGSFVETGPIQSIEVPSVVREIIGGRIQDLTEDDRTLLDVAAVMGFEFEPDLVARVCGLNRVHVLQRLAAIERRTKVVSSGARIYRFDHHQIQEVLYSDLPPDLRGEYHALLAEAYADRQSFAGQSSGETPGEEVFFFVSQHLKGARPGQALPYLGRALDHLEKGYRNEAAIHLAQHALSIDGLVEGLDRSELGLRIAGWLGHIGRRDEEQKTLLEVRSMVDGSELPGLRGRVELELGRHFVFTRSPDTALEHLDAALGFARLAGETETEASVRGQRGNAFYVKGLFEDALAEYEEHLRLARDAGDRRGVGAATGSLGNVASVLGRFEEANDRFREARDAFRGAGDRRGEASALLNLGTMFIRMYRLDEAEPCYVEALELSRAIGYRRGVGIATGNLGIVHSHYGRMAVALEYFKQALDLSRDTGDVEGEGTVLINMGAEYSCLGDFRRAEEACRMALACSESTGAKRMKGYSLVRLADLAGERGEPEEAERLFREALALWEEIGYPGGKASVRVSRGVGWMKSGRHEEARAEFAAALEEKAEGARGTRVLAWCGRAALDPEFAEQAARELAAHEARMPVNDRVQACALLHRATGDAAHLDKARSLLMLLRDGAPEEYRESMLEDVASYREILAGRTYGVG